MFQENKEKEDLSAFEEYTKKSNEILIAAINNSNINIKTNSKSIKSR